MCVCVCVCVCVCACMCLCIHPDRQGHNSSFYTWISKLFDFVVVLEEEKRSLKHFFLGGLKVKVTLEGHMN